jgi:hypothetical protein
MIPETGEQAVAKELTSCYQRFTLSNQQHKTSCNSSNIVCNAPSVKPQHYQCTVQQLLLVIHRHANLIYYLTAACYTSEVIFFRKLPSGAGHDK